MPINILLFWNMTKMIFFFFFIENKSKLKNLLQNYEKEMENRKNL